ncbi:hypothetical protein AB5J72_50395 [Streptomyces sp. CG1]|uniref:hypothetical protein n=1 Tax=Streptomyces sp. CG1 TaxID=1287523 RepID=UPI0034E1A22F
MTTNPALADNTSLDAAEARDSWTSQLLNIFAVRPRLKPEPADDSAPPHSLQVNSDGSVSLERRSTAEIRAMVQSRAEAGEKAPQDVLEALLARGRAANGDPGLCENIDRFTSRVLCLQTGDRWREAVSTALLGDWTAPLASEGRLTLDAIGALRGEIRTIHRQLMPLWRRRTGGSRVLLLETPWGRI